RRRREVGDGNRRGRGGERGPGRGARGGRGRGPGERGQRRARAAPGPGYGFGRGGAGGPPASNGGGFTVYGHIIPEAAVGQRVSEGQRIARIDPNSATNGGVAPHLHLEWHRYVWSQPGPYRLDPEVMLRGAGWHGE